MASLEKRLTDMLEPAVSAIGFELWGLEFVRAGSHSTLRVYIDHEDGVSVDNCADCSRQISAVLDVEDPISKEYYLEVSSPGMERPLYTVSQYEAYIGHGLKIKTRLPQFGQRKFQGTLQAVDNGMITIVTTKHEVELMFDNIERAHLVAKF
ncbi:ribosome maturation factor RimP [Echinimonas agarilytica]|uniref:Ribosome maturation factor RimP n=1 Tax=Echinimonas agarilytica TaxID=1215918 RepID=A0AA42B7C4_9GAMM|nr:ribosome maturation factor RimP [Echinimonas agarilytica]MCM2679672.1 ribosome maturation factor RimP [Echinimonas agarilytica]